MRSARNARRGFTLVEMLVAVTLVLLMMSMFAQIFQIAGGAITKQRGIAENDQRTRTFQNILKADLDKRTFRLVMPWAAGEDANQAEASATDREGYLYISENDPLSDIDDLLQFTTNVRIVTKNRNSDPYVGKATQIANLYNYPNQPEADDARPDANGAGQSSAAEISYFLRGGNLYRRVLLIREPLKLANSTDQPTYGTRDAFDWNDTSGPPNTYPRTGGATGSGSTFWNDFDYSAYFTNGYAHFHGLSDLTNSSSQAFSLGKPQFRFGHHPLTAHSREWSSNNYFLGRYTHEETSVSTFNYPQALVGLATDPMSPAAVVNIDETPDVLPYRVVSGFANGPRRGEDLILANVHMFDVKVWDGSANFGVGRFVDIGYHRGPNLPTNPDYNGDYTFQKNVNSDYGSDLNTGADADHDGNNFENRVFDTWHPDIKNVDFNNDGSYSAAAEIPPYRRVLHTPVLPGATYADYENWVAAPDTVTPSRYSVGSLVFPQVGYGALESQRLYYVCVASDPTITGSATDLNHGTSAPTWPRTAGGRVLDGDLVWEAVDNWKPLRALQITVRFFDVTSNQMRQNTFVHSLVD
ncbi:type II secretion system protein [Planctellipticum variicoloris]|uniref:type II secretion system protein n=1 Tax=Planctellipticum variicoloris TaxID=3064265 RepID=UPI0030138775|nr:type II secretion system GspH family protein [Planctomycetaceae bacterium SH412]